ncbi:TPR repeat domain-containing protein [Chloropicon primus]|uniref:Uncharacterized protein n=1 Tax=Chloropicon primus TaxID=1764295 RepID=A0A5B8MLR5_9CHLO|nr:hypothetical protein A3770_04p34720 [Chloropicon primus]UPR00164.1 TPR repeat domain-containing protein [Chloropicon primus]|eukprot:QDZ20954.1 hypothetical protein A3770_04p34720 [Chloropicon primus]
MGGGGCLESRRRAGRAGEFFFRALRDRAGGPRAGAGGLRATKTTRREAATVAIALAEAALDLVVASCCEVAGRPKGSDGGKNVVASLLPQPVSENADSARIVLQEGEDALSVGDYRKAVVCFTKVLELAPSEYKLCQRALLKRTEANRLLGNDKAAGEDFRQQWLWGRGLRWPGHYAIIYILLRRGLVQGGEKRAEAGERGVPPLEWIVVLVLVATYNLVLAYNLHEL